MSKKEFPVTPIKQGTVIDHIIHGQSKNILKIIKLEDESHFEDYKGEAETIAGFVLEISGIFPRLQSKINFKNYVFTIEALDKKRIKLIKFTIKE